VEQQNWRLNNLKKSQLTVRFIIVASHRAIDRNERTNDSAAVRTGTATGTGRYSISILFIVAIIIIMIIIATYTVYSREECGGTCWSSTRCSSVALARFASRSNNTLGSTTTF